MNTVPRIPFISSRMLQYKNMPVEENVLLSREVLLCYLKDLIKAYEQAVKFTKITRNVMPRIGLMGC